MSYQQQPYRDNTYGDGNQYGNSSADGGGGYGGGGRGYTDDPSESYNKYGNNNAAGDSYPMSSSNPYASGGSARGYDSAPKKRNKWLWIGLPILLLIVIGAVLGGVLGTQLNKDDGNSSSGGSSSGNSGNGNANTGLPSGVTSANTAGSTGVNGQEYLAVATNTAMLPVYQTGTNTAGYSAPTVIANAPANGKWPSDPSPPSNSSIRDHPRLGAPSYKWAALTSGLVANDPYLSFWNETIMRNATFGDDSVDSDPLPYTIDGGLGGNGVLDIARQMKVRVKLWSYAYRMTNETRFVDRVYRELQTAAGNNTEIPFGTDNTRWNPTHFLDLAEFCNVFAIGYDWLYDAWTDEQRDSIMWSIINLGLTFGEAALTGAESASAYRWWTGNPTQVNGNWNCVCNGGLLLAALAIQGRDQTGISGRIIDLAVPNAGVNCFQGAYADGTWAETPDYWYFGTTAAAEMVSALITSYGDDRGLTAAGPGFRETSLFHIYNQGMTSKFNFGDNGPNKFSSTANSLFVWADVYNEPRYALYQRDHFDAPEPWSMFWYDPATSGTWWDNLPLDKHFDNELTNWATARSNWVDNNGAFWAMKAGQIKDHQNHHDMDLGDFVIDAQGNRWFGELGNGEYLSNGYFNGNDQDSPRWSYYNKRTEGQNTVVIGDLSNSNQLITANPSVRYDSTGTNQGLAPSLNVSTDDTAFYTVDISSAYNGPTVKRGIRFLNGRRQFLIQDDITAPSGTIVQWRAHTNATVTVNSATATLVLNEKTLVASILNGPSGVSFATAAPTATNPVPSTPPIGQDQLNGQVPNSNVTVLTVNNPNGGSYSLEILLNPQWDGLSESNYVRPSSVALDSWSLTSHN